MQRYDEFYRKYFLYNCFAEQQLSGYRYRHSRCVAELASDLCRKWGVDPDKGFVAGLLHDIAREKEPAVLLNLALLDGYSVSAPEMANPVLLHARAAVMLIRKELGINDKEIHQAILDHIAGRPAMNLLSSTVFIADLLEPSRDFIEETERLKILDQNIDNMLLYVIEKTAAYYAEEGKTILTDTWELYNEVKERIKTNHEKE